MAGTEEMGELLRGQRNEVSEKDKEDYSENYNHIFDFSACSYNDNAISLDAFCLHEARA